MSCGTASVSTGTKFNIEFEGKKPADGWAAEGLDRPPGLSHAQVTGLAIFSWYYIWCSVMLAVLLLRLLMAMMTNTYTTVRLLATRHWRLQFARCVLQMEMVAGSKGIDEAGSYHEVVTKVTVVDGVPSFQLFSQGADVPAV